MSWSPFWIAVAVLILVAVAAGIAERARRRRRDLDRMGIMEWRSVQLIALIGAFLMAAFAWASSH